MRTPRTYTRRDALGIGAFGIAAIAGFALGGCASAGAASDASDGILEQSTLTIVSDLTYPPMVVEEGTDDAGFGVGVCDALGEEMGLTVVPEERATREEVYQVVSAGEADLGAATFEPGGLPEGLTAANALVACNLSVVMRSGATLVEEVGQLTRSDLRIFVQDRPAPRAWAEANLEEGGYELSSDDESLFRSLRSSAEDVAIVEQTVALYYIGTTYTMLTEAMDIDTGWVYGFFTREGATELRDSVNAAVDELRESGRLGSLEARWLGARLSE